MKLVIKYPTRNRPEKFLGTLNSYIDLLTDKSTEIIVTCDLNDDSMNNDNIKNELKKYPNVKVFYGNSKSKIEAINNDLENVEFDILLLASDDMIPVVSGYDTIIKNKMIEHYPDTDGVLWFNDGFQGRKLNTLSIIGKKYYNRFGYIYEPTYLSMWCDNEFMDVAEKLNRQTYFDEIIIQHQHPSWGYGKNDDIYSLNIVNEKHDMDVYNKRKSLNFNL